MEDRGMSKRIIDLTGQRFGRLEVISFAGQNKWGAADWLCRCDCGNMCTITAPSLKVGNTRSCGCITKELQKDLKTTHGMHKHPAYRVWASARSRTHNINDQRWEDYGGRGITMCQEWADSFEAFWADMGPTYKTGLSIDRVDNDLGYYKENCKWDTESVQAHRQRKQKGCSSQYIGVNFHKPAKKYRVEIRCQGVAEYLGLFSSEVEAAITYDNRSEELFGDRPNKTERR